MRSVDEAIAYHAQERAEGSREWYQKCLVLARTARDLPARYPSALAAQEATPVEDRIYDVRDVKRGMVAYWDDPNDSNPWGHITTVHGRNKDNELLHWTNDASGRGAVSLVQHSFFPQHWGDAFQFAATSLNGFDLTLSRPKPRPALSDAARIREAIDSIQEGVKHLDRAISHHEKADHPRLVKALKRDRTKMRAQIKSLKETVDRFDGNN